MIGKNLNRIREEKGLGVNELSKISGVNASYISALERGVKNNPSPKILIKLAEALQVENTEFYKDSRIEARDDINPNPDEELRLVDSLDSAEDAIKFILSQPSLMSYGGYDLNKMSEEEIMDLANDMLLAMKINLEKNKRK